MVLDRDTEQARPLGLEVREVAANDLPFLCELLVEAAFALAPEKPSIAEALGFPRTAAYVEGWGRAGDLGLVAEVDGVRAGAAWCRLFPFEAPGYGFVDVATPELTIAVVPGLRRKGVGSALLEALVRRARRGGYPALSLSVDPANPAIRLYERAGFVRVPRTDLHVTMLLALR